MLMAVEDGRIHQFRGESLDSIDINGKYLFYISVQFIRTLLSLHNATSSSAIAERPRCRVGLL